MLQFFDKFQAFLFVLKLREAVLIAGNIFRLLLLVQPCQMLDNIFPWTSHDWSWGKKAQLDGCHKQIPVKNYKTNEKKKKFNIWFGKSLWSVFLPCASFIFTPSVQSVTVSVWEQAELSLVESQITIQGIINIKPP